MHVHHSTEKVKNSSITTQKKKQHSRSVIAQQSDKAFSLHMMRTAKLNECKIQTFPIRKGYVTHWAILSSQVLCLYGF